MAYIAIDTETTGLPGTRAAPHAGNIAKFDKCRMLSIAIVEFDSTGKEVYAWHKIVYPDDFKVDATHIHGITQEKAEEDGCLFEDLYHVMAATFYACPNIVGHNLAFDLNVIQAEMIRRGCDDSVMDYINPICTLKLYKSIFLTPIKLGILYNKLIGKELEGAHDALNDARAAGEVYTYLKEDPRVYKALGIRKVIIKASEVAACMGLNNYRKPDEVIKDLWAKYSPETFQGQQTRDQRNIEALSYSSGAQKIVNDALKETPASSDDVQSVLKRASALIETDGVLSKEQKDMVNDHMRKMIYTTHGTNAEDKTADLDEAKLRNDDTFYKFTIDEIEGTKYEIVGRIDRIQDNEDGTKTLVEIKNRTKALFNKVRDYEFVQVQSYLHMMDLEKARLIEQFNNERKSYDIPRDCAYWETFVVPKLQNFCKTFHHTLGVAA